MGDFRLLAEILVNDILPSLRVNPKAIEKIKNGSIGEEDPNDSSEENE